MEGNQVFEYKKQNYLAAEQKNNYSSSLNYCKVKNGQLADYSKGLFKKYLEGIAAKSTEKVDLMMSVENDQNKFYVVKSIFKMPVLRASSKWSKKFFFYL